MTRMPSLFLSGLMDQLIPSKMMMELYQVIISSLLVPFAMTLCVLVFWYISEVSGSLWEWNSQCNLDMLRLLREYQQIYRNCKLCRNWWCINQFEVIPIISCIKYCHYRTQVTNLKGLSNGGKSSSPLHTSWESPPPPYQQASNNTNNTKYGSGNTNTNNNPVNTTGRSLAEVWNV